MKFLSLTAAAAVLMLSHPANALTPAKQGDALNDAQIIQVAKTTGDGEIKLSELALKTSQNEDVRSFATTMVTEHTDANAKGMQIAEKLGVKPTQSDTSQALAAEGNENYAKLSKLKGADFDKAYADAMIADHKKVTTLLQRTLIPAAQNGELQAFLKEGLTKFEGHLEHAQALEDKVDDAKSKM